MGAEELQHHLNEHKLWLATAGAQGRRLDMRGECLADTDLTGAELESALFCGTDFYGARLCYANLKNALMERCELQAASLFHARLNGATLNNAAFLSTSLRQADLHGASLHGTDLRGCELFATRLPEQTWLILGERYDIQITNGTFLRAGCQEHTIDEWRSFSREEIAAMGGSSAVSFYPRLLEILDSYLGAGHRPDWVIQ